MIYFLLLILSYCFSRVWVLSIQYYALEDAALYFEDFVRLYDKHYTDENEKEVRFQIFKENLADANRLNEESKHFESKGPFAVFGITEFMDLTSKEFTAMFTTFNASNVNLQSSCRVLTDSDIPAGRPPDSLDWRTMNAVTRVKHQGNCGSCYSFSSTGHLEGQIAIKYQKLIELSEQQIVDCDKLSHGCHTGYMSNAFMSVIELGGIMSETDYPYMAREGSCSFSQSKAVAKINACYTYSLRSQESLQRLLAYVGPISIGVRGSDLQKYQGGVFPDQACSNGGLNHAVLLVGYGTDNVQGPYWIVKNSYGPQFGESGYFRMQRGEGAQSCGMMNPNMASAAIA